MEKRGCDGDARQRWRSKAASKDVAATTAAMVITEDVFAMARQGIAMAGLLMPCKCRACPTHFQAQGRPGHYPGQSLE
ncbi:hypothetical protein Scep_024311 [Stephania cephalantha]|uniref:Uncharacterized protein n=1 Tax=Stephania cephalantha TaxID=152367 RepID=A0AAP0EWB8_9MAGN